MSTMSSDTLFHFTNSLDNLIGILKNEFYSRYSLEKYTLEKRTIERAFPMVCFCNIPLSQIKNHLETYGYYGIGMSKEWAEKNGLNPVLYLKKGSTLSQKIETIRKNLTNHKLRSGLNEIEAMKIMIDTLSKLLDILRYIKSYEGDFYRKGKIIKDVRFYDEREWRYMPDPEKYNGSLFLSKDDFQDPVTIARANAQIEKAKLSFEPSDIKYIIVTKEEEILSMVKALHEIKSKYNSEIITKLTTRIITSEQIENDF